MMTCFPTPLCVYVYVFVCLCECLFMLVCATERPQLLERPTSTDVASILGNIPPCTMDRAANVFHMVMSWARMTIQEIAHLQWRQIGYEVVGDGTAPPQPLFERKNPNAAIAELVNK